MAVISLELFSVTGRRCSFCHTRIEGGAIRTCPCHAHVENAEVDLMVVVRRPNTPGAWGDENIQAVELLVRGWD